MRNKSLKPATMSRRDWFHFADREIIAPHLGNMLTTHAFKHMTVGDHASPHWEQEEWQIQSYLVPLDGRHGSKADVLVATHHHSHDIDFQPWWRSGSRFDFGESRYVGEVSVRPWIQTRTHRLTDQLIIEPRPDFIRYHAADQRVSAVLPEGTDYVHPLDDTVILRTASESVAYYNPSPFVQVQRDYLRDYLAARRASLLISLVADRFANARSVTDLELKVIDQEIAEFTSIRSVVHEASPHNHALAMGRCSLYWNILIRGYDRPKRARNPWHLHDERLESPKEEQPAPTFIADDEGLRRTAGNSPAYLYFNPRVLERYFRTPGHAAGFHMRTWGAASSPHGSMDIGVNSRGLLTVFMPDIAKLPIQEQNHWASYSVAPEGEICWAMFETRMQSRPPHQPGVIELVAAGSKRLHKALDSISKAKTDASPTEKPTGSGPMSIGPLGKVMSEVGTLAVYLHKWVIDGLSVSQLRAALTRAGITPDKQARQLSLLRTLLTTKGVSPDEAKRIVGPLDALNEFRAKAAHLAAVEYEACLPHLALKSVPVGTRAAWDTLVDRVVASLNELADELA